MHEQLIITLKAECYDLNKANQNLVQILQELGVLAGVEDAANLDELVKGVAEALEHIEKPAE